jgi:L-fucose isomerase-like protein
MDRRIKAGFVGFGEVNTPRDVLDRKVAAALYEIERLDWDVEFAGIVSDDPAYLEADAASGKLRGEAWDLIVLCIAGWIPSHAVIRVIEPFRAVPMLVWGLSGSMENGRMVTAAGQAGTTGLCFAMRELGFKFRFVYSVIGRSGPMAAIDSFARAAMTIRRLRDARIGSMGYRDMLLYCTMFDGLSLRREIGPEVETFEMLEIIRGAELADPVEVRGVIDYCRARWQFQKPVEDALLERGARYYLALEKKVQERRYEAVTLIDVDGMKKLEGFPPAMIFMLLADRTNVCTAPENDIIGNVTQLIIRGLTGQAAHYMEFYDFFEDRVLVGAPDYVPAEAVDGPVVVLPTAFGLNSSSLLNVSKVKGGRVTLVRLIGSRNGYFLHVATGDAIQPSPWEECGWTAPAPQLPSLEVVLDKPVAEFAQKVASQHTIVAYGDITDELTQFASLLGIGMI